MIQYALVYILVVIHNKYNFSKTFFFFWLIHVSMLVIYLLFLWLQHCIVLFHLFILIIYYYLYYTIVHYFIFFTVTIISWGTKTVSEGRDGRFGARDQGFNPERFFLTMTLGLRRKSTINCQNARPTRQLPLVTEELSSIPQHINESL